jgi:hypothetical protein
MNYSLSTAFVSVFLLLSGLSVAHAESWKQGAFAVVLAEDDMEIFNFGSSSAAPVSGELPTYLSGLIVAETKSPRRAMVLGSNGVLLDFKGGGYFAVERFEQQSDFEGWQVSDLKRMSESRMILNLREGTMVVEQRKLLESSQLVLETPVGRIAGVGSSFWMIELARDARKRTYLFNIYCIEGTVRLSDLMGRTFTIRSGQRISGAGASETPSIEVAEVTSNATEYIEDFEQRAELVSEMVFSESAFAASMSPLKTKKVLPAPSSSQPVSGNGRGSSGRPMVIEYSPRMAPITPFQGVARPPSAYEADLF